MSYCFQNKRPRRRVEAFCPSLHRLQPSAANPDGYPVLPGIKSCLESLIQGSTGLFQGRSQKGCGQPLTVCVFRRHPHYWRTSVLCRNRRVSTSWLQPRSAGKAPDGQGPQGVRRHISSLASTSTIHDRRSTPSGVPVPEPRITRGREDSGVCCYHKPRFRTGRGIQPEP